MERDVIGTEESALFPRLVLHIPSTDNSFRRQTRKATHIEPFTKQGQHVTIGDHESPLENR